MDELWKYKVFANHSVAAAGSVALGTAITYPFDTIKVIVQVSSGPNTQVTVTQAFTTVKNLSGYSGLFRGFGWLAFGRILGTGTRFGTYELITAYFKDGRPRNEIYASEALIAGTACGAAESLVTSPFEILKLRSQATSVIPVPSLSSAKNNGVVSPPVIQKLLRGHTPDMKSLNHSANLLSVLSSKPQNLTGALQAYPWMMTGSGSAPPVTSVRKLPEIVSLEGWSALWRGLRPGLVRDSVYGGFFFTTWHFLHQALLDWKAVNMVPVPSLDADVGPLPPLNISLAAGFSGSVAAAASHCFDTAKSRQLCCVMPKFVRLERKLLELKPAGTRFERWTGIHPFDRKVLYKGIWLRMARCGIGSFLVVRCYFFAVDQLVSRGNMLT